MDWCAAVFGVFTAFFAGGCRARGAAAADSAALDEGLRVRPDARVSGMVIEGGRATKDVDVEGGIF